MHDSREGLAAWARSRVGSVTTQTLAMAGCTATLMGTGVWGWWALLVLPTVAGGLAFWSSGGAPAGEEADALDLSGLSPMAAEMMAEVEAEEASKASGSLVNEFQAQVLAMGDILEQKVLVLVAQVEDAANMVEEGGTLTREAMSDASSGSSSVHHQAESVSGAMQNVVASVEELSSAEQEIVRQAEHSAAMAREAVAESEETDRQMADLKASACRIGDVVGLINDIAEQTNLLALNATIESARAGEAGKGFAVVAEEVKRLASQTSGATQDIADQVQGIQQATESAARIMRRIGGTIAQVDEVIGAIALAVAQQEQATREISGHVLTTANTAGEITNSLGHMSRSMDRSARAADESLSASSVLKTASTQLSTEVRDFLTDLRGSRLGNRRRHPRVPLGWPIEVEHQGRTLSANLVDVSMGGAFVEPVEGVNEGDVVILQVPEVGPISGGVAWQGERKIGLRFEQPLDMEISDRLSTVIMAHLTPEIAASQGFNADGSVMTGEDLAAAGGARALSL